MRIVFELEADGFTHLACRCSGCGDTMTLSFGEIRSRMPSAWSSTLDAVAPHLACRSCPGAAAIEITPQRHARTYRGGPR